MSALPESEIKLHLSNKLNDLQDDLKLTESSFVAKDAIKSRQISRATIKFADKLYRARLYEILDMFSASLPRIDKTNPDMIRLKMQLQDGIHYSFSANERFRNPYPSYLFFSQAWHGERFSGKVVRKGVSGELVADVADKIRTTEISPDYLRVEMYFAPFRGGIHPFAYNNRTLVAFSRAMIDEATTAAGGAGDKPAAPHARAAVSRIVPCMPTQDLINRVEKLDEKLDAGSYPNTITDEDAPKARAVSTTTMLPGPRSLY
jgi:hypothetical protein